MIGRWVVEGGVYRLAHRALDGLGQGPGDGLTHLLAQRLQGPARAVEVGRQRAARGDERARKVTHGMPPLVPNCNAMPSG